MKGVFKKLLAVLVGVVAALTLCGAGTLNVSAQGIEEDGVVLGILTQWDSVAGVLSPSYYRFTQDLHLGMTSPDVKELQQYLNLNGFSVASEGPGSPGQETDYFGELTERALARFQTVHNVMPAAGYFGILTRTLLKPAEYPNE